MTVILALLGLTAALVLRRRRFDLWTLGVIGIACLAVTIFQHQLAVNTVYQSLE